MSSRPRVVAIVPSAGHGKRLGSRVKKPFVLLGSRPLITYALNTLDSCEVIDGIIIAAEKSCIAQFENLVQKFRFKKIIAIVAGGESRGESVRNCLAMADESFDIVLVHDGARPFVDKATIRDAVGLAEKFGGCVTAVAENDTVKLAGKDLFVKKTLDRSKVFRAQTPQAFKRGLIIKAYADQDKKITDDSSLVEGLGKRVKILKGSYRNIKITTIEDLKLAEALL